MTDRVRVFNRAGLLRSEFNASVSRAYIIGARADAQFTIATNETYCNGDVLNFGNWLVVQSDNKPDWVGTIAGYQWGVRTLTVTAHTPEWLLSKRIGEKEKLVRGSAGEIFAEIIAQANKEEKTLLTVGNIYDSDTMEETLQPTSLDKDLKRIFDRSGEEYDWRVGFTNGKLIVYCDWVDQLGKSSLFTLQEGTDGGNIEAADNALTQDEPDANYIYGYGNGLTWADKPFAISEDATSQNQYGLLQKSISYYGVKTKAVIQKNTYAELQTRKYPSSVYHVVAIHDATSAIDTFLYLAKGNTLNLKSEHIGFTVGEVGTDKRARIFSMYYNPLNGEKIELGLKVAL